MSTFVVAGATGHVGSVVAAELLSRGAKVKAIVRDPKRGAQLRGAGAELAAGSLDDARFLRRTLTGASGFFAMTPPNATADDYFAAQRRFADAMASAVRESGTPCVVMLSSLGAELPEGTGPIKGLHYLENVLRATGAKLIAIRACYFQENIAELIPAALQAGIYPNFLGSASTPIPMVATRDIGRLAASLLLAPPQAGEIVDLVGPEYSASQLGEKLSAALGKPLQVVDIPAAGHVDALMQAGFSRPISEIYAEMYAAISSGRIVPRGDRLVTAETTIDEILPALLARPQARHASQP